MAYQSVRSIEQQLQLTLTKPQREALKATRNQKPLRHCLFFPTGKGKTVTALAILAQQGKTEALVLAPPVTHKAWEETAEKLGITVTTMSVALFRKKGTKVSKSRPIIVDEFHELGSSEAQGFKKLDVIALRTKVDILLLSATPFYNDAERTYCVQHILDPHSLKGGFLKFIEDHCETEFNPFSVTPTVTGFKEFRDATHYLSSLDCVSYIKDDAVYEIVDIPFQIPLTSDFTQHGMNYRKGRVIASGMEYRHARIDHQIIDDDGLVRKEIYEKLTELVGQATTPVLVFCMHATVAEALANTMALNLVEYEIVTGKDTKKQKQQKIDAFKSGKYDVLIGTSTLATGTDGLDKMCDWLIIVDDTDDHAKRRQLVGRILSRGSGEERQKYFMRFTY